MDLIGSIHYLENRLNGRKPQHGKPKPARKNSHSEPEGEKLPSTDSANAPGEYDSHLGRKLDTTA